MNTAELISPDFNENVDVDFEFFSEKNPSVYEHLKIVIWKKDPSVAKAELIKIKKQEVAFLPKLLCSLSINLLDFKEINNVHLSENIANIFTDSSYDMQETKFFYWSIIWLCAWGKRIIRKMHSSDTTPSIEFSIIILNAHQLLSKWLGEFKITSKYFHVIALVEHIQVEFILEQYRLCSADYKKLPLLLKAEFHARFAFDYCSLFSFGLNRIRILKARRTNNKEIEGIIETENNLMKANIYAELSVARSSYRDLNRSLILYNKCSIEKGVILYRYFVVFGEKEKEYLNAAIAYFKEKPLRTIRHIYRRNLWKEIKHYASLAFVTFYERDKEKIEKFADPICVKYIKKNKYFDCKNP